MYTELLSLIAGLLMLISEVLANPQPVGPPALKITTDYSEIEDTVTAGNVWLPFAKYVLDTYESGESVSVPSLTAILASTATTSLAKCRISDGTAYLTAVAHAVNPVVETSVYQFIFDNPLVVLPNTVRTLLLSCNVIEAAVPADLFRWGLDASKSDVAKGALSGREFVPTIISDRGAMIVVAQ